MNELTDILNDVERLNAERARGDKPEQPVVPPTEGGPTPPTVPDPVEAGPPRLLGVDFKFKAVGTTLGNFELTEEEITSISRVALRAVARALKATYAQFAGKTPSAPLAVVKRKKRRAKRARS